MPSIAQIARLSPLPIVNLESIGAPHDGTSMKAPAECQRLFTRDQTCRKHYERMSASAELHTQPVQCPYGFCSYAFRTRRMNLALTGVIPFPRIGGEAERKMAKKYSESKRSTQAFKDAEEFLKSVETELDAIEKEAIDRQSVALHEIRKLNRTVKQTAERLCLRQAPDDPDLADPDLVKIWKSAELMSMQFDVIELLGNEGLFALPLNTEIEIYRVFDKCVRIYRPHQEPGRITIRAQAGYRPRVLACDKTFHMIPTVLIENALKYSSAKSVISIDVSKSGPDCIVRVRNEYEGSKPLTDAVFERGVRLANEKEGSGNGLYLARLVASQHKAQLIVSSQSVRTGVHECVFKLVVPEAQAMIRSLYGSRND